MKYETIIVTGGIGSGKSSVINTIKAEAQAKVEFFNFDDFTKDLYKRQDVQDFLQVMFGTTDQTKISDMIFSSGRQIGKTQTVTQTVGAMREALNDFFLKLVEEKFLELVNRKAHSTLVIEFPMYFEAKALSTEIRMARSKVKVIVVVCDDMTRIRRVQARDGFDVDKIKAIFDSQLSQRIKIENADYVIDTSDGPCENYIRDLMQHKFKKAFYHVGK